MKKLTVQLNQLYKSFENGFQTTLEGDLVILSGVNGSGKSQITNIISGFDQNIASVIKINGIEIRKEDVDFRSFKENIGISEITELSTGTNFDSANNAWVCYKNHGLNASNPSVSQFSESCAEAKKILLQNFSEQEFCVSGIKESDFKTTLQNAGFVWRSGDKFTNTIGEMFFAHALKVSEMMKEVSRSKFDPSMLEAAPWSRLNTLFEKLKFNYRFKSDYEIIGISINEQPKLYTLKLDGTIEEQYTRNLSDLSDGEKTIISLCFASLNSSSSTKKLLLLDELDSVLNPSLIQSFFEIIKEFFVDKGVMVIMTTHSPATISLSPSNSSYYEVFKPNKSGIRISAVCRDEYSELQIANKEFYDKISDQDKRIESLTAQINSDLKILIITEGKTDWKYMLKALEYYHSKKEFVEIKEDFFYRFGSEEDVENQICGTNKVDELSDTKLKKYLDSLVEARKIDPASTQIRIGIFDSDNSKIQVTNDNEKRVFSFKIVPEDISTEFIFNDDELKAEIDGRRLYIGREFHPKSQKNIDDPTISLGGDNSITNKAGEKKIIEAGVFNNKHENIALTKEKFAQAVFNGEIEISEESWEGFRYIFVKIQTFIGVET